MLPHRPASTIILVAGCPRCTGWAEDCSSGSTTYITACACLRVSLRPSMPSQAIPGCLLNAPTVAPAVQSSISRAPWPACTADARCRIRRNYPSVQPIALHRLGLYERDGTSRANEPANQTIQARASAQPVSVRARAEVLFCLAVCALASQTPCPRAPRSVYPCPLTKPLARRDQRPTALERGLRELAGL